MPATRTARIIGRLDNLSANLLAFYRPTRVITRANIVYTGDI